MEILLNESCLCSWILQAFSVLYSAQKYALLLFCLNKQRTYYPSMALQALETDCRTEAISWLHNQHKRAVFWGHWDSRALAVHTNFQHSYSKLLFLLPKMKNPLEWTFFQARCKFSCKFLYDCSKFFYCFLSSIFHGQFSYETTFAWISWLPLQDQDKFSTKMLK